MASRRTAGRGLWVVPVLLVLVTCTRLPQDQGAVDPRGTALADPSMISAETTLAAPAPVAAYRANGRPVVATGADVRLVVWSEDGSQVRATRVRISDGAVLEATGLQLSPAPPSARCWMPLAGPAVAFTAGVFLVVWTSARDICAVRVRPDGTVLDAPPLIVAGSRRDLDAPAVSADGTNFLVVWGESGLTGPGSSSPADAVDIRAARVRSSDGVTLDPDGFVIGAKAGVVEKTPAATFDGTNFFVAWSDASVGVVATRVRPADRALLDTPPVRLSDTTTARQPSVTFNGTQLLAVWDSSGALAGRRVNPATGAPLEPGEVIMRANIAVPGFPPAPVVGHDGVAFAVAWRGVATTGADTQLKLQRFDNALVAIADPMNLDGPPMMAGSSGAPGISSSSGKHYVAWTRSLPRKNSFGHYATAIYGTTVDGTTGTPTAAELVSRQLPLQEQPEVSFDGRQHLVVWREWNGTRFRVRGARLRDSDGALLDPNEIDISPGTEGDQIYSVTASNGSTHLVLWSDSTRLQAARVRGDDGAVLDSTPLALPGNASVYMPRTFAVASDGTDYLVLMIEGTWGTTPSNVSTIRVRADGTVLDATPRAVISPMPFLTYVSLAYVQSHYVAVWIENPNFGPNYTVRLRRLDKDGTPLDPVLTVGQGGSAERTRVVAMGGVAAVMWSLQAQDLLTRVRVADATVLEPQGIALLRSSPFSFTTTYASTFDGQHLLSATIAGDPLVVRLQRVTPEGAVLDAQGAVVSAPSDWGSYDLALSGSPQGRSLLVYGRFDPAAGSDRLRFRWLGALPPPSPPDPPPPPPDAGPLPVDAPVPPVDAPVPSPVDAPAPPVDPPGPSADGPSPSPVDAGVDPDGAPADAGMPDTVGDTLAPPADATIDGRDASGDGPRDARGDGGIGDEEPDCSCALGSRPTRPGGEALLAVMAFALIGGRRSLRRRRGRTGVEPNRRKPSAH